MTATYELHPLTEVFPALDTDHFADLKASIAANGQRNPITIWRNQIIDGRHRYQACQELGITPLVQHLDDAADPLQWVVDQNGLRRNMATSQRAMVAAQLSSHSRQGRPASDAKHRNFDVFTYSQAARAFAVSEASIHFARKVIEYGDEDIIRRCRLPSTAARRDRLTVSAAAELVTARIEQEKAAELARAEERAKAEAEQQRQLDTERERIAAEQQQLLDQERECIAAEQQRQLDAERTRIAAEQQQLLDQERERITAEQQRAQEAEQAQAAAEAQARAAQAQAAAAEQALAAERAQAEAERQQYIAAAQAQAQANQRQVLAEERAELEAELEQETDHATPRQEITGALAQIAAAEALLLTDAAATALAGLEPVVVAARTAMGSIELDPASSHVINETVQAHHYFTNAPDALSEPWTATTLWLNPPPEQAAAFLDKLCAEVAAGNVAQAVAVIAAATVAAEFSRTLSAAAALCRLAPVANDPTPAPHRIAVLVGAAVKTAERVNEAVVAAFCQAFKPLGEVWHICNEPASTTDGLLPAEDSAAPIDETPAP